MSSVEDELEFLSSAYGSCFQIERQSSAGLKVKISGVFSNNLLESISILLPPEYPAVALRVLEISCASSCRIRDKELVVLRSKLSFVIDQAAKYSQIACLDIIQSCNDFLLEFNAQNYVEPHTNTETVSTLPNNENQVVRIFIYFHHIKSPKKKKEIKSNAEDLYLSGIWKEGFPGLVLIEGKCSNAEIFVENIKQLRWQQMSVRGIWPVSETDIMFTCFQEVEDMSEFSKFCREKQCEHIFKEAMKMNG